MREKLDEAEYTTLVQKLESMLARLKQHRFDISINKAIDTSWYMQKAETMKLLVNRFNETRVRMKKFENSMRYEYEEACKQLHMDMNSWQEITHTTELRGKRQG